MSRLWTDLAAAAGVTLSDEQLRALQTYLDLLLSANATLNLTRITDPEAARIGHIADSLTLLPFLPAGAHTLADVGSGGGVPGIPLAIARPDGSVTLIEATKKKAAFLTRAVAELHLTNVRALPERAESLGRAARFDVVTARAVGSMDDLARWCLPLVKPGGKLLAQKGPRVIEELPAAAATIKRLGGGEARVHAVSLPGAEGHVVVEVVKGPTRLARA